MKRKKFGNVLDIPMPNPFMRYFDFNNVKDAQKEIEKDNEQREIAFYELFDETRPATIGKSTRNLIRKVAREFKIPGFMSEDEIGTVGRPSKWKGLQGVIFWSQVEFVKLQHSDYSVQRAINSVKAKYKYPEPAKSLLTRYNEIDRDSKDIKALKLKLESMKDTDKKMEFLKTPFWL